MNQGQICKLKRRIDGEELGWFQRLRMDNGSIKFCKLNQSVNNPQTETFDTYDDGLVDSSGTNKYAGRPLEAFCIVPASAQVMCTVFAADDDIDQRIARQVSIETMQRQLANLNAEFERAHATFRTVSQQASDAEHRRESLLRSVRDLEGRIRDARDGREVLFSYAYGRHTDNGREFCWRIPDDMVESITPGASIIVETDRGHQTVTVTRVERLNEFIPHKLVVGLAPDTHFPFLD